MDIIPLILNMIWIVLQIIFYLILFALFLILVILFTNLKYQLISKTTIYEIIKEDRHSQDLKLKVTYLFRIISVQCIKKDSKIKILVRVFGKAIFKQCIVNSSLDDALFKNPRNDEDTLEESEDDQTHSKKTCKTSQTAKTEEHPKTNEHPTQKPDDARQTKHEIDTKQDKKTAKTKKESDIDDQSSKKSQDHTNQKQDEKTIIDCFKNKDVIVKLFDATSKMLKKLKPDKFITRLKLGFDDPSITGQLVGIACLIKGATNLDIEVEGEFNEEIKPDIFIYVKGKISIIKLIYPYFFVIPIVLKFYIIKFFSMLKSKITNKVKNKGE